MEPLRDCSSHLDASPPISSSLSSTSESCRKFSSSSASDDGIGGLSKQCLSLEERDELLKYSMDCPFYVPQGIFSNLATPVNMDAFLPSSEFLRYPENSRPRQHEYLGTPPSDDFGFKMMAAQRNANNYFVPEQSYQERSQSRSVSSFPVLGTRLWDTVKNVPIATSFPRIHIYSNRKVNFAGSIVPFIIQVFNPPNRVQMQSHMFEAVAESPLGITISCRIRSSDSYLIDSFVGTFKTNDEAGSYEVRVQMVIPANKLTDNKDMTQFSNSVIYGVTHVPVCKNYGMDAQRECLRIHCGFRSFGQGMKLDLHDGIANSSLGSQSSEMTTAPSTYREIPCKFWGLTCDLRNNNILYSDRETHQVFCVSPNGDAIFKFGRNDRIPLNQQLCRPTGIAFDEVHNRFIICDKDNHRVCFFSLDGKFLTSFGFRGHENGTFEYPWDVAVAPNGAIAISDSKNKRVQHFDNQGNFIGKYTVYEVNPFHYRTQFDYPRGVCFDNTGNYIYVTDFNVNNVMQIPVDFSGHHKLLPAGTLLRPQGIAMDNNGNLLVADSRHDCIRYMNPRGDHLYTIREIVKKPLAFPINITTMAGGFIAVLNGSGNIYIF